MNNTTVNESCLLPEADQPTGLTAPMRYFLAATLLLASLVGVVGNIMVIAANAFEKKIRSSTNLFLANMATADLMTSLICDSCLSFAWFFPAFKPSCLFRDVMGFVYFFSVDLSVVNSSLVAWNRYVLITKPLQTYNMLFTPTKIAMYCITSWISTFLLILLVFAYFRRLFRPPYILISVPAADMSDMVFFVVNIIEIIILVVAPILLTLFFYIAIFLKIRKVKERVKVHAAPNPNAKKLYRPSRKERDGPDGKLGPRGYIYHVRISQEKEHFLINPYGMMYNELTAASLVKVDMQGQVIDPGITTFGINKGGFMLHSAVHQFRPDCRCVLHLYNEAVSALSDIRSRLDDGVVSRLSHCDNPDDLVMMLPTLGGTRLLSLSLAPDQLRHATPGTRRSPLHAKEFS
uniref:G-protein coupled receptors family 1 profile domain-containing protein n=1 Tax=Branchiostoma floridae TaxID=7739 RepID=C3Y498_BRAFL|eukprot:XP_002609114.1 hypothetical protein BRAFLDRAFT_91092 [Branchiostoma floridae]